MSATTVAVGNEDGYVVLHFPMHVVRPRFEPAQAAAIAQAMLAEAGKLETHLMPVQPAGLREGVLERLHISVAHMIRSLLRQDKTPEAIAIEVVKTVLKEVL